MLSRWKGNTGAEMRSGTSGTEMRSGRIWAGGGPGALSRSNGRMRADTGATSCNIARGATGVGGGSVSVSMPGPGSRGGSDLGRIFSTARSARSIETSRTLVGASSSSVSSAAWITGTRARGTSAGGGAAGATGAGAGHSARSRLPSWSSDGRSSAKGSGCHPSSASRSSRSDVIRSRMSREKARSKILWRCSSFTPAAASGAAGEPRIRRRTSRSSAPGNGSERAIATYRRTAAAHVSSSVEAPSPLARSGEWYAAWSRRCRGTTIQPRDVGAAPSIWIASAVMLPCATPSTWIGSSVLARRMIQPAASTSVSPSSRTIQLASVFTPCCLVRRAAARPVERCEAAAAAAPPEPVPCADARAESPKEFS